MGRTGIEPDIENVSDLLEILGVAIRAQEARGRRGEPGIGAFGLERFFDAVEHRLVVQHQATRLVHEDGQRHAPRALARQHPVGATFYHGADAVLPARRIPIGLGDGVHRQFAERLAVHKRHIDGYEPLRRGAEDHGRLGTPAMRIGMAQSALGQQLAMGDQFLDHRPIGVAVLAFGRQDALAREVRYMRRIGTVSQHHVEGVGILVGIFAVAADQ